MSDKFKIFACSGNPNLAIEICEELDVPLGKVVIDRFANENIKVRIEENVREADVFVLQSSAPPVNENIMEMLIMIDALKYASAKRITAVIPYFPYVRSDKKDEPRISITARLMGDLLGAAGANRVLTMDLHAPQIQGFFTFPCDHLIASPIICDYFKKKKNINNFVVVATDAGGAKRTLDVAKRLGLPLAICDKRRDNDGEDPEIRRIIGDVKGKNALIYDDEVSTGGSLVRVKKALEDAGAEEVCAACVHGVLCNDAVKRLSASGIKELVVTNTLPVERSKDDLVTVLSVAPLFASAIHSIHTGASVSDLFR